MRAVAEAMAAHAYAPYSGVRIGAGLLTGNGQIYGGCNVENASFGLSQCAERAAVAAAVAGEGGDTLRIRLLAICSGDLDECPPCGACRQVIAELGPDAVVLYPTPEGEAAATIDLLLPRRFTLPRTPGSGRGVPQPPGAREGPPPGPERN